MSTSLPRLGLTIPGALMGAFGLYVAALVVPIVIRVLVPAVVEAVLLP